MFITKKNSESTHARGGKNILHKSKVETITWLIDQQNNN